VPLIVAPPPGLELPARPRTQDLYGIVLRLAGLEAPAAADLETDELLLTELGYQTYRKGRFKATFPRATGWPALFDLEADPLEQRNVRVAHLEVMSAHRRRVDALSESLAARNAPASELTAEDRARLEALGYLEEDAPR